MKPLRELSPQVLEDVSSSATQAGLSTTTRSSPRRHSSPAIIHRLDDRGLMSSRRMTISGSSTFSVTSVASRGTSTNGRPVIHLTTFGSTPRFELAKDTVDAGRQVALDPKPLPVGPSPKILSAERVTLLSTEPSIPSAEPIVGPGRYDVHVDTVSTLKRAPSPRMCNSSRECQMIPLRNGLMARVRLDDSPERRSASTSRVGDANCKLVVLSRTPSALIPQSQRFQDSGSVAPGPGAYGETERVPPSRALTPNGKKRRSASAQLSRGGRSASPQISTWGTAAARPSSFAPVHALETPAPGAYDTERRASKAHATIGNAPREVSRPIVSLSSKPHAIGPLHTSEAPLYSSFRKMSSNALLRDSQAHWEARALATTASVGSRPPSPSSSRRASLAPAMS